MESTTGKWSGPKGSLHERIRVLNHEVA